MPHGESSGNALIYNASEVAGYLSGNDKDEYQRVRNALCRFFDIPENSWRKRGNLASGGPASYIEHFWVACQVQGITITPAFDEELKNARHRAGVRELPEIREYMRELQGIKEASRDDEIQKKKRKSKEVGGDKLTPYINDALEELGKDAKLDEVRDYLVRLKGTEGCPIYKITRVEGRDWPIYKRYSVKDKDEIDYILDSGKLSDRLGRARKALGG